MEKRTLGMTGNNAMRFRKNERERVLKALAAKQNLTVDQINRMLASK